MKTLTSHTNLVSPTLPHICCFNETLSTMLVRAFFIYHRSDPLLELHIANILERTDIVYEFIDALLDNLTSDTIVLLDLNALLKKNRISYS